MSCCSLAVFFISPLIANLGYYLVQAELELVCVVDDDKSTCRALRRLLKLAGYSVEVFSSAKEYLTREIFSGPVCLVLDIRMPGLSGLELQRRLKLRNAGEQIIFITGHGDVPTCTEAMKHGAVDFLLKPFEETKLIDAVRNALASARDFLQGRTERQHARRKVDTLTPKEFEVFQHVIRGLLNKQIAAELKITESTIKVHRGRVMRKLGLTSVPDLVRFSQSAGIESRSLQGHAPLPN